MATSKESNVDVLIVGAGPAGLMLTSWMSRLGIKTRTIDKRGTKVFNGQADGLQARTLELFESFGFSHKILHEAQLLHDMVSWGDSESGGIERKQKFEMTSGGLSNFDECVLNQGYIERFFIEDFSAHSDIKVERGVLPSAISIDESKAQDQNEYAVTLTLQHLSEQDAAPFQSKAFTKNGGSSNGLYRSNLTADDTSHLIDTAVSKGGFNETVHAKYVVGCDGAHSWTRQQLGLKMEGENTDYIWGVVDVIPITDFPDIRRPGTVQSEKGSILIIPREKKLVRLYVQLHEVNPNASGQVDKSEVTPERILKTAKSIFEPYSLDYTYCDWWTGYQVGQRVGTGFCDPAMRVFLAGDAVHTHSPKAGQGMNVSMQDTYNLGWKLGGVVNGWLPKDTLATYQPERRKLAQDLIAFDHKLSRMFSGSPTKEELSNMYRDNMLFISGFGVRYLPSAIVAAAPPSSDASGDEEMLRDAHGTPVRQSPVRSKPQHARNIGLGETIKTASVLAHCDTCPTHLKALLPSDGRWRLVVFPGDVSDAGALARLNALGDRLSAGVLSRYSAPRRRATPASGGGGGGGFKTAREPLVDVLVLHSAPTAAVDMTAFGAAFLPFDPLEGYDYYKVYADKELDDRALGKAYEFYGVDESRGAMVVLRPDQYVALITGLEDVEDVEAFFDACLLRQDGERQEETNGAAKH